MADVICFDIDGVLTLDSDTDHQDLSGTYATRQVNKRVKGLIARAIKEGWTVTLFTGRKEGRSNSGASDDRSRRAGGILVHTPSAELYVASARIPFRTEKNPQRY